MTQKQSYQVLARKYRPSNFEELIGQEVLVETLTNAIANQKIAHAFILTGIRGIGKTTTARIIAKALNCLGEDEKADIPRKPCGKCSSCVAIANSRHQDVIEIDAASRTGVDDIREIIDSIGYAPATGRYKVYIIDEVHMLSNNAFNALLKTLEEPPAHTKFIFATTEIRKVPITVLSRCQRFDLRRLNSEELAQHLANVLQKEGFEAQEQALSLIADAAEGSVRDALSITDRALSHNNYQKSLSGAVVADIIGLNDKGKIIDLFELILQGNVDQALHSFNGFYENGTDPVTLLQDLLEINHKTTICKSVKDYKLTNLSDEQQKKIVEIADKTSIANLARIWQMMLKGLNELSYNANQKSIFEMLLIRICHLSNLPSLEKIIAQMDNNDNADKAVTKAVQPAGESAPNNSQNTSPSSADGDELAAEIIRNFEGAKIVS
ncbi:MAG: DNA polymerase III subunit gamma/tau [Proteobacteria bacterium]|nr:DNA polymerase III subunit gamma/tau [Pseudomonadota bacterium]